MVEYVVVKTCRFDPETKAVKFDDYRKATAYLHWIWEQGYNEEMGEGSDIIEEECYYKEDYAKIEWFDGDYVEFNLIEIDAPMEDFPSDWERYVV